MRTWWVSNRQTFREEFEGGYLWSPQRDARGRRLYYWDTMREIAPGEVVLSFADQRIRAVGRAQSHGYESPRPHEFKGRNAEAWGEAGWRVDVQWNAVKSSFRPKHHIDEFRHLLPEKYSPLQPTGDGNQFYLVSISTRLAEYLLLRLEHVGALPPPLSAPSFAHEEEVREILEETELAKLGGLDETTRRAVVAARKGQGRFRQDVMQREPRCRVTDVRDERFLTASHIWPWRHSTNGERLDGNNGLMLSPAVDRLFDKGFITFEDDGRVTLSQAIDPSELRRLGVVEGMNVGSFSPQQAIYLRRHREGHGQFGPIFRKATQVED